MIVRLRMAAIFFNFWGIWTSNSKRSMTTALPFFSLFFFFKNKGKISNKWAATKVYVSSHSDTRGSGQTGIQIGDLRSRISTTTVSSVRKRRSHRPDPQYIADFYPRFTSSLDQDATVLSSKPIPHILGCLTPPHRLPVHHGWPSHSHVRDTWGTCTILKVYRALYYG